MCDSLEKSNQTKSNEITALSVCYVTFTVCGECHAVLKLIQRIEC